MNDPETAIMRRKIELYRRYLAQGAGLELSNIYLIEMAKLQSVLDEVENQVWVLKS